MIVERATRIISGRRVEIIVLYGDSDPPYSWLADCPLSTKQHRCKKLSSDKRQGSPNAAITDAQKQIRAHLRGGHKKK